MEFVELQIAKTNKRLHVKRNISDVIARRKAFEYFLFNEIIDGKPYCLKVYKIGHISANTGHFDFTAYTDYDRIHISISFTWIKYMKNKKHLQFIKEDVGQNSFTF